MVKDYEHKMRVLNTTRVLLNISDNVHINNSLNNTIFTIKDIKDNNLLKYIEQLLTEYLSTIEIFISQDIPYINNTSFIKDSSILNTCVILIKGIYYIGNVFNNSLLIKDITYNNNVIETKFKKVDKLPFLFIAESSNIQNCEIVDNMATITKTSKDLFSRSYHKKYAIDFSKTNCGDIDLTIKMYLKDITEIDYLLLIREVFPYNTIINDKYEKVFFSILEFGKNKFNTDYLKITNDINIFCKESNTINEKKNFFKLKTDRSISVLLSKNTIFYYSTYYKPYHKKTIVLNTNIDDKVCFLEKISDEQLFICKLLLDKSSKLINIDSVQNVFNINNYIEVLTSNYKLELINKNYLPKYYITMNDFIHFISKYYLGYSTSYNPYLLYENGKEGLKILDIDINDMAIVNNLDINSLRFYPIKDYQPILQNSINTYTYSDIDLLIYSIKNINIKLFNIFDNIDDIKLNTELFKWSLGIDIDISKYTGKKIILFNDSIKNKVEEYNKIIKDRYKHFNDNNKLFKYIYDNNNKLELLKDLKEDSINGK